MMPCVSRPSTKPSLFVSAAQSSSGVAEPGSSRTATKGSTSTMSTGASMLTSPVAIVGQASQSLANQVFF